MESKLGNRILRVVAVVAVVLVAAFAFSSRAYAANKGWTYENGAYYYYENDGTKRTNNWASYNGTWYYLGANGKVATNRWVSYGVMYYYVGANGKVATNSWIKYQGKYYYADAYGHPLANKWLTLGDMLYYFDYSGACAMSRNVNEAPVTVAFSETVTDSYGNLYSYRLPAININSAGAASINAEIEGLIEEAQLAIESVQEWGGASIIKFNYSYSVTGNVCSLVILCAYDYNQYSEYYVFNIDISTGERLSDEKVLQYAGISTSACGKQIKAQLNDYFHTIYPESLSGNLPNYAEQLERTLAYENVADSRPFFDQDGKLCVVARYYALAGPSCYYVILTLQ